MLSIDVIITDHTIFNEEMFSLSYERFKVADEIYAMEQTWKSLMSSNSRNIYQRL